MLKSILKPYKNPSKPRIRSKTTSSQYVASRSRDPTFEKFMEKHKNLSKVTAIQDLILANPQNPPSVSIDFLSRLAQKLHLNRGAVAFLRKYPHIFDIFYDPTSSQPSCKLTHLAMQVVEQESAAIRASMPVVIDRLIRVLFMSVTKSLPLRAIFKLWREFGLPDDFEHSVISQNPHVFKLCDNALEPNTHVLKLVCDGSYSNSDSGKFAASVDNWRVLECCKEDCKVDRTEIRFSFKHGFPPGMRLSKDFKAKVKEWQRLRYMGPYEVVGGKESSKALEKRAVAIVHEFMSLTVEKMVEVEKISHFRKWFGIDLNIRDLFLDHPGMFYLSAKGKKHTVFLREAYERGCLIEPNPVYDARRKLLDLVLLERRGFVKADSKVRDIGRDGEVEFREKG